MVFNISEDNVGKRLDTFISENMEEVSRSLAQKLLEQGKIKVNNAEVKSSYKLKANDVVDIDEDVLQSSSKGLKGENIPLDILYEDDDILVVNKPKNMVVHPRKWC